MHRPHRAKAKHEDDALGLREGTVGRVTENVDLLPSALRLEESQAVLSKDQEQRKRGQEGPEGAGRGRGGPDSGPAAPGPLHSGAAAGEGPWGRSPPGVVEVNQEPVVPKFGERLVVVPVHVSCGGGEAWARAPAL